MKSPYAGTDWVYFTMGLLYVAAGLVFGFAEGWNSAWGWFAGAVPSFLLARRG